MPRATRERVMAPLPNTPIHAPRGHTWHHPDGQLKELILGTLDYPGRTMPGFAEKMTGPEVDAVFGIHEIELAD